MRIETECLILERERSLLEEIQSAQAAVTIYAYGMETQDGEGTVAYAFAMHQEDRWVEVYQRLETLDDEEYARIHIQKHIRESTAAFPITPHERVYRSAKQEQEVEWTEIAVIQPPFSLVLFRDTLHTCCETRTGEKIFRQKLADVAFSLEGSPASATFQVTSHPYFMRFCHGEKELTGMEDVWYFHFDDEKEFAQFEQLGSEEVYHCQRVEHYSRNRIDLSGSVAAQ